jgi:hypothetical protein
MKDRSRRWATTAVLGFLAASALLALLPASAVACSCVGFTSMEEYVGPDKFVFEGTIQPGGRPGVDVAVARWFQGPGGPIVALAPDGFNDQGGGADCRVPYPAAGSSWIFVAFVMDPGGQPQVNLCTPQGRIDTPEGQAMLADAIRVFGEGSTPSPAPGGAPAAPLEPVATAMSGLAPIIGAVAVAGVIFAGLAIVLRRRDVDA